ncbi:MAG: hypothetical protein ABI678_20830 [Kofleriaceae bacterium]
MKADELGMLADLEFTLARVLWAPYCDRERAVALAELAVQMQPDAARRAEILAWLQVRLTPPLDELAVATLQQRLRAAADELATAPFEKV